MKIPEILLVATAHQGRTLAEITVEIDDLANNESRNSAGCNGGSTRRHHRINLN